MLAHAVCPRASGLIDMDTRRRLTRPRAADVTRTLDAPTHGVVEDEDAVGLQRRAHEGLCGGIVDAPDLVLVVKILHDGRMPHQLKTLAVQRKAFRDGAAVEDRHQVRLRKVGRLRLPQRRDVWMWGGVGY